MGEGTGGVGPGERDAFDELRAAGFFDGEAPREPSAEERLRIAARRARQADLQRRLAEEAEHERRLAERDRKRERKVRRSARSTGGGSRYRNFVAPAVVLALLGGLYWMGNRNDSVASVAGPSLTPQRPDSYPPVDESVAGEPLGAPPDAPQPAGPFEFAMTQESGEAPVAYDPCRPVRYVVNDAGAPPGSEGLIDDAIARTAAATGLVFVSEGSTSETWSKNREAYQPDRYDDRWAPVLITWSNDTEVPGLAGYIAGMGGSTPRQDPTDPAGTLAYVTGQVVLDAADLGPALTQPGGADAVRSVIQHELGHLVGLDHVADPTQLMYSEGNTQVGDWAAGDLAGLHQLGTGECLPEL